MEYELCVYCECCEERINGFCFGYHCDLCCIYVSDCISAEELEECLKRKTGE